MTRYVSLEPNHDLLNPEFECYKLSASEAELPRHYGIPLPRESLSSCAVQDSVTELQLLAYRMHLNGLFGNPFSAHEALFFDDQHGLWKILLGEEEIVEQVVAGHRDLVVPVPNASLVYLNDRTIAMLRGTASSLELISLVDEFPPRHLPLSEPQEEGLFMRRLVDSCKIDGHVATIGMVEVRRDPEASLSSRCSFCLRLLRLNLETLQVEPLARYESKSRPVYVRIGHEGVFIASNQPFVLPRDKEQEEEEEGEDASATTGGETGLKKERLHSIEDEDDDGQFAADAELNNVTLVKYSFDDLSTLEWRTHHAAFVGSYVEDRPARPEADRGPVHVAISHGDDALVFAIRGASAQHICTYDAMAFVQASKQDRRYVLFLSDESLVIESSRHVFVYQRLEERRGHKSKQFLVDLESEEAITGWAVTRGKLLLFLTRTACHVVLL